MYDLQVQCKHGISSGEAALFLNGLTDRTPKRYQLMFPMKKHQFLTLKNGAFDR